MAQTVVCYLSRVLRLRATLRLLCAVAAPAALALVAPASLGQTPGPEGSKPAGRTRFVTLYDSHGLTPFGDRLDTLLLGVPGADLVSTTLGGASPGWLLRRPVSPRGYVFDSAEGKPLLPRRRLAKQDVRTPPLDELLRVPEGKYARQAVILTLGSNVPGSPTVHTEPVERIVRSINARSDTVCIWVGPPSQRKWSPGYSDQVYAAIREGIRAAGPAPGRRGPACHFIDSRQLSAYPAGGDGTHYGFTPSGTAAAHRWAEGVAGEIDRILRSAL